ncbi:MAG: hypothetical protein ACRYF2_21805, partial [Janthinobacterium lividum]
MLATSNTQGLTECSTATMMPGVGCPVTWQRSGFLALTLVAKIVSFAPQASTRVFVGGIASQISVAKPCYSNADSR